MATTSKKCLTDRTRLLLLIAFAIVITLSLQSFITNWNKVLPEPQQSWNSTISRLFPSNSTVILPLSSMDWQPVSNLTVASSGSRIPFRVYSAFAFQDSSKFDSQLIVIGSHAGDSTLSLQCQISSTSPTNFTQLATTPAKVSDIFGWNTRYSGVYIMCPLPLSEFQPKFVSILPLNDTSTSTNRLPINFQPNQGNSTSSNFRYNFSVCVLPTYGAYNKIFHFLEWLEYYKMLGIQHFTLYNMNISSSMSCLWKHLSTSGQIAVHSWHSFPLIPHPEEGPYAIGYSAALADCQFRYTGISKYVAVVDFDEFITPVISNITTFPQLINYLDSSKPLLKFGEYVFKNGFFMLGSKQDPSVGSRCAPLLHPHYNHSHSEHQNMSSLEYQVCKQLSTMKYVHREPFTVVGRTKYIMMPERARVAGNHDVNQLEKLGNFETCIVDPGTIAYHRHYWDFPSKTRTTVDQIDVKVGLNLAKRVAKELKYFKTKCGLKYGDIFI